MKKVFLFCILLGFLCISILGDSKSDIAKKTYKPISKPKAYLYESFDEGWEKRWLHSGNEKYNGVAEALTGEEPQGVEGDKGLLLPTSHRYYGISAKFDKPIDNTNKELVVQYEVRLQRGLECGGGYLKLFADPFDPVGLVDSSPYIVMFGPDKCGSDQKVHFIFRHENPINHVWEEKHMKNRPVPKTDKLSHLYTLHILSNNSFAVYIDQEVVRQGNLLEDFDPSVIPPKEIDDPEDKKPEDWVDEAQIPDPNAVKPDDWDVPAEIVDPEAVKPEDWNDEEDGDWIAPTIANPDFKGEWKPNLVPNPAYKGEWKARQIPNPNYFEDRNPHNLRPIGGIGFEIWTITDGILFDNVLVTDDKSVADEVATKTWKPKFEEQSRIQKEKDEALAAERKKAEGGADFQYYVQYFIDFVGENPYIVIGTVALGIIVPVLLCLFVGGSNNKPSNDNNTKSEKKEEKKEASSESTKKEEVKSPKSSGVRKRPPKDN